MPLINARKYGDAGAWSRWKNLPGMQPVSKSVPSKKPHQAFATPPSPRKVPQRVMLTTEKTPAFIRPVAIPTSNLQKPASDYNKQIVPGGYYKAPSVIASAPTPGVQVFGRGLQPMQASISNKGTLTSPQASTARGLPQGLPRYHASGPSALTPSVPWKPGGTSMHVPPQQGGGPGPKFLGAGYQPGVTMDMRYGPVIQEEVTPADMSKPGDVGAHFGRKNQSGLPPEPTIEAGSTAAVPAKPVPWKWIGLAAGAAVLGLVAFGGR